MSFSLIGKTSLVISERESYQHFDYFLPGKKDSFRRGDSLEIRNEMDDTNEHSTENRIRKP